MSTGARRSLASLVGRHLTMRRLRLASGLVLFAYVVMHLANHSVGNVSLGAMEATLDWIAWGWGSRPGGILLYGALIIHSGLGLWALFDRPRLVWTPAEGLQLVLGLALPPLLVNHVVSTRLAYTLFGTVQGYAQQFYVQWVQQPDLAVLQAIALLAAWLHGCIGLQAWLRLKRFYPAWAPALLCGAVLVPILALLGFTQGGRAVIALAADPDWVTENAPVPASASPEALARYEVLVRARWLILGGYAAAVALALAGRVARRLLEHSRGIVRVSYPTGEVVRVPPGTSVLEASRRADIPHASVCGGRGRCSTCRIRVFGENAATLPDPSQAEGAVLERIGAGPGVRLACQLRPKHDISVAPLLSPEGGRALLRRRSPEPASGFGEERFVVAMFVDMRGSTRLAERRLPYDTVFVINRFLEAVGGAVAEAGGAPNQFLGDGVMALFGTVGRPEDAARGALEALALVARNVATLNGSLGGNLDEPVRYGIGLHAGTAILGEIGDASRGRTVFTAIGDPVNVAARLQALTKRLGVEAVVSEVVYRTAGATPPDALVEVEIDGRDGRLLACPVGPAILARHSGAERSSEPGTHAR